MSLSANMMGTALEGGRCRHEAPRVHHASRRRSGVAARSV